MRPNPLSIRVMALSWAVALFAWPLAWLLLAVAPGIGVVLAGGEWIGVALPLGLHPQAVVNEPTVAFAATRAALSLYWLAPSLASLGFSLAVPTLLPVPRGWFAELAVFQLGFAAATLGLGWAPPLGQADGPAAAMARFWEVRPALFLTVSAGLGVVAAQFAVARLSSHLWSEPGGPRRMRRLVVMIAHGLPPALLWIAAVLFSGWPLAPQALLTTGAVLIGGLFGAWHWMPRSPLRLQPHLRWRTVIGTALVGTAATLATGWAGSPSQGHGKALLWGVERMTSNLRPGTDVVRLTPRPAPRKPPAV